MTFLLNEMQHSYFAIIIIIIATTPEVQGMQSKQYSCLQLYTHTNPWNKLL